MAASPSKDGQAPPAAGVWSGIPRPRTPLSDSLRRLLPGSGARPCLDLNQVIPDLVEVAVWTSRDGCWQEHASFLLGTSDGRWHMLGFSEPAVSELISRLRELPGFDTDLLLDLIGSRTERLVPLWQKGGTDAA
jgi:hypothetical protein